MDKKRIIVARPVIRLLPAVLLLMCGCSDQFMKDKTNYNLISPDAVYSDYKGAQSRVDYLYRVIMSTTSEQYMSAFYTTGRSDIFSQSTEEYSGISTSNYWINRAGVNIVDGPDFFYFENKETNPWGRIRECNDVIENVLAADFTEEEKKELLGQAYFWRAWVYYQLIKLMGGVPIIDKVQDPIVGNGSSEGMAVPRSTTRECVEFICNDLQTAADYLPEKWLNESVDYGRLTKGAALAVMGRVRLLYASPLFNRQDDPARWELAYEVNKQARELLRYTDARFPGVNASEWARMFAPPREIVHPEAVLFTLYSIAEQNNKLNSWENAIRPKNIYGGNGIDVTYTMIDLFPMSDGKRPHSLDYRLLPASEVQYNQNLFFLDRDPRFYRTFAFPGERWAAYADLNPVRDDSVGIYLYPYAAQDYELWSYA
ncbi:MAG: RagB/SusD family nutrient uptake outer membrane protein [Rikenellaceae bacterium]|nr:RagB/SusD family nutrient uptake outer membrane protein [Rikenellaceae bacterium]